MEQLLNLIKVIKAIILDKEFLDTVRADLEGCRVIIAILLVVGLLLWLFLFWVLPIMISLLPFSWKEGGPQGGGTKIPSPLFFAIIKVPSRQKPKLLVRFVPEN